VIRQELVENFEECIEHPKIGTQAHGYIRLVRESRNHLE